MRFSTLPNASVFPSAFPSLLAQVEANGTSSPASVTVFPFKHALLLKYGIRNLAHASVPIFPAQVFRFSTKLHANVSVLLAPSALQPITGIPILASVNAPQQLLVPAIRSSIPGPAHAPAVSTQPVLAVQSIICGILIHANVNV